MIKQSYIHYGREIWALNSNHVPRVGEYVTIPSSIGDITFTVGLVKYHLGYFYEQQVTIRLDCSRIPCDCVKRIMEKREELSEGN